MGFRLLKKSLRNIKNLLLLTLIFSFGSVNARVRLESVEQLQIDQYDVGSYESMKKDLSRSSMEMHNLQSTEVEYDSSSVEQGNNGLTKHHKRSAGIEYDSSVENDNGVSTDSSQSSEVEDDSSVEEDNGLTTDPLGSEETEEESSGEHGKGLAIDRPQSTEVQNDSSVEDGNDLNEDKSPGYRTVTVWRTIPDFMNNFKPKQIEIKYRVYPTPGNEALFTQRRSKRDTKNAAINAQMDAQSNDDSTVVKPEGGAVGTGGVAVAPSLTETGAVGTHGGALNPDVAAPDATITGPLISAVVPNDTCMTMDDIMARGRVMGLPKTRKCPKNFPCQRRQSCRIWHTGLVHRKFNLDLDHANQYYSDLFIYLNEARMKEALDTFSWCAKSYYLEQAFMGDQTEEGETYKYRSDGTGLLDKIKPVHEHEPDEPEGSHPSDDPVHPHETPVAPETPPAPAAPDAPPPSRRRRRSPESELLTDHESFSHFSLDGLTPEPPYDYTIGVRNCEIRMEDFMECFEMILLKAVCYWMPPDSFATA